MKQVVAILDDIAGSVGAAPNASLKRLHCLAAVLAVLLHATLLLLGFWLCGATPVRNLPHFISVSLDRWPSGEDAGEQEPVLSPGRESALPRKSAAARNSVFPATRAGKNVGKENPAQVISQESGGVAGEENRLTEPAAGGGTSLASQAAQGPGSGTGEDVRQGVPAEVLARPLYVMNPQPLYPRIARQMGKQGVVLLEVFVSASGNVAEVKVATGSGYEILDEAALNTVRGWRFAPGLRNGQPAAMWVRVPVRFELRG